jgi:hypothetical protein
MRLLTWRSGVRLFFSTLGVLAILAGTAGVGVLAPAQPSMADDGSNGSDDSDRSENSNASGESSHGLRPGRGHHRKLKVHRRSSLKFGVFASDIDYSGTVVINASTGAKTTTGGVFDFGGASSPAVFLIRGRPDANVVVDLPTTVEMVGRRSGARMTIRDLTV